MNKENEQLELFSVIMPVYNQGAFIKRAIRSLFDQAFCNWELIIINDGSSDNTYEQIVETLSHPKVVYIENSANKGLGYAINQGLDVAKGKYISYLPADDFFYKDHLLLLYNKFKEDPETVLVFSGITYAQNDSLTASTNVETPYIREGYPLQLVQTAHKKTDERWLVRDEFITEDLYIMFWHKLLGKGYFNAINKVTCFWTQHPLQRHKIAGEKYGGCLNLYRTYYKVKKPLKMRFSKYKFVDENQRYADFHTRRKKGPNGLKILLVGELSYNPERIYALEKSGHELYGLWITKPNYPFANVGHLAFGNIKDIYFDDDWIHNIKRINPDVIYALGNWDAVELAYTVLKAKLEIPFVWHFKEGPQVCIKAGLWEKLCNLYLYSDGKIFINEIIKEWYELFLGEVKMESSLILDLDPPISNYFHKKRSAKLSKQDGEIHTVVTGRLVGVTEKDMKMLAKHRIHLHLYSESAHEGRKSQMDVMKDAAPDYFHTHHHIPSNEWVKEFSQYDAGWLHCFISKNYGNILKATWDDMNIPARIYTLAAAGLPMIQMDNKEHLVAMHQIAKQLNIGIFYNQIEELGTLLYDHDRMNTLNTNVANHRMQFTFDYHIEKLEDFFYKVINLAKRNGKKIIKNRQSIIY